MSDQTSGEKPTAQVFRLTGLRKSADAELLKADTGAVRSNALQPEDEYQAWYGSDRGVLEPPYNLRMLDRLSQENNTLSPCIEAMITNIDGTGYDFETKDDKAEDSEDDKNIDALRAFFAEPWPGETFLTQRQALRRDLERVGNAFLEALRNPQGDLVFTRHVDAKMMRLVRLDEATEVKTTVVRGGKPVTISTMQRQRRFCQTLNGVNLVYFKEFGVERDLNKNTGTWAPVGQKLPAHLRATEIIHFKALPDAYTDYGVPRWISQLPSVLGSRKAEEYNLEFFDNGGIPPVLILLQGGTLQSDTRKALEQKMALGRAADKQRVQVMEVEPTGGSLEGPTPTARVTVERFGADQTHDSTFEVYDDKCEKRVRRAFRLPPMFVGDADSYSFATAVASYAVAEAQVFKPERDEFDRIITMTLISALGYAEYKMASKPLVIEDVELKLRGVEVALSSQAVDLEDVLFEINEATGLNLKYKEPPPPPDPLLGHNGGPPMTVDEKGALVEKPPAPGAAFPKAKTQLSVVKAEHPSVVALAHDTLTALRKRDFTGLAKNVQLFTTLDERGRDAFRKACASLQFIDPSLDHDGLAELAGCTISVMQRDCGHTH